MGYIKFDISSVTDASGRITNAVIKHIDTDMGIESYDLNRILHSLAVNTSDVQMWMVLGEGILDRDKLKGRECMILDSGTLDVDYI